MSMLPFEKDTDLVYNRNYKVCYYIDDKRIETGIFTNKLINIDNTYFLFSSIEYGLAVIRQDMVVYMGCVDEPKKVEDNRKTIYIHSFDEVNNFDTFRTYYRMFENFFKRKPTLTKANIETLKNIFSEFEVKPFSYNLYCGCKIFVDNNLPIGKITIR